MKFCAWLGEVGIPYGTDKRPGFAAWCESEASTKFREGMAGPKFLNDPQIAQAWRPSWLPPAHLDRVRQAFTNNPALRGKVAEWIKANAPAEPERQAGDEPPETPAPAAAPDSDIPF